MARKAEDVCIHREVDGEDDRVSGHVEGGDGDGMGPVGRAGEGVAGGRGGQDDRRPVVQSHLEVVDAGVASAAARALETGG